ncbi:MAG TPA: ArsA family ATPase [Terriglobales bacterium]|nr:ArsA family ATPase [Terriglobales bacterium]
MKENTTLYNSGVKQLTFFVGKGGVGKTTVSSAYAVRCALQNREKRVLLLSTDPAHSLSDVLQLPLKDRPRRVRLSKGGELHAWQINPEKLFREFLNRYKEDILDLVDKGSIFTREDIAPLLDTTLPGMAEMSALLAIRDAINSGRYSHIVVDTAPFGHTLRLFSLPEQFVRFLNFLELAASRDQVLAEHFGGRPQRSTATLIADFRVLVQEVLAATSRDAEIVLVTTAEKFSLNESVRCSAALNSQSPPLQINSIVLNRATPGRQNCRQCAKSSRAANQALSFLKKKFPKTALLVGEDSGSPIMGSVALAAFADHMFAGKRLKPALSPPRSTRLRLQPAQWPVLETPLALVLGKGGVGKTTVSAALGYHTRRESGVPVEICSVDPAPSLDDIFEKPVGDRSEPVLGDPKFKASELDSVALFRAWVRDLQASVDEATTSEVSGIHVDLSFERRLLSELLEIVPPGVDEVLAIFRILDLIGSDGARVVIDMAPTGHALELLRMPQRILAWTRPLLKTLAAHRRLAFAREVGVKIAELSHRVRELAELLAATERAQISLVMLPEPLPDRETERLIAELAHQRLPVTRIFVNRVVLQEQGSCPRCNRVRQWQRETLARIKQRYSDLELLVIRNFPEEITGKSGFRSLTGEIWRLA